MDRNKTLGLLAAGGVLVGQSLTDLAPAGPWDSASFSRGVLGLFGLVLIYLAWFAQTFGFLGVAPTVDRWKTPETTWLKVVVFGLACLVLTRLLRLLDTEGYLPEPTGLVLGLVGVLALMNGTYVWLIVSGPLAEEEE